MQKNSNHIKLFTRISPLDMPRCLANAACRCMFSFNFPKSELRSGAYSYFLYILALLLSVEAGAEVDVDLAHSDDGFVAEAFVIWGVKALAYITEM